MAEYTLHIRRHYSGLFIGYCLEQPEITVMGRDHEEVTFLARQAIAQRLDRLSPPEHCSGQLDLALPN